MSTGESDFKPSTRFGKITGRRALGGFVLFFAIIFGANGLMVYRALSTFDGVEVEGAYQKGRAYNHVIERMEAQKKLGWSAGIETRVLPGPETGKGHSTVLSVTFADAEGRPVEGLSVQGTFWRPVVSGEDSRTMLRETAPGTYEGLFSLAGTGNWQVRIAATGPRGETFVDEKRVVTRAWGNT
jgi:nitrogen fixation protein FixH